MWWLICLPIITLVLIKLYVRSSCGMFEGDETMNGKVVIVTGANTGIGYETAKDLAKRGAKVILGCRDENRGTTSRDMIIMETENKNVIYKNLNLASFKSIRDFAEDVLKNESRLDILINNAGTGKLDNSLTEDYLPIEMQINHYGPFLLTQLLLPLLQSSAPSRIINVSSVMHNFGTIDLDRMHMCAENYFSHMRVYSNSKLANLLFTRELASRLSGSNVTANCLHPGAVNTDIFRHQPGIVRYIMGLIFKTPWEGAQTSIYLSVSPEVERVTGQYFSNCKLDTPSRQAQDSKLAAKLWDLSERIVYNNL